MKDAGPWARCDEGSVRRDEGNVFHDEAECPHREKLQIRCNEDTFVTTKQRDHIEGALGLLRQRHLHRDEEKTGWSRNLAIFSPF